MTVVLVCGGRYFSDVARVFAVLSELHSKVSIARIVHGAMSGADLLAERWARVHEIDYAGYPAKWKALGPQAGPIRNGRMLAAEVPHYVVGFPGGRGTADCVGRARKSGMVDASALVSDPGVLVLRRSREGDAA